MILNGYNSKKPLPQFMDSARTLSDSEIVAEYTISSFKRGVPSAIPMIAFLSGGQHDGGATENLNAINKRNNLPWYTSFSFGRELQQNSLKLWASGDKDLCQSALIDSRNW